jgi:hypothetical protein
MEVGMGTGLRVSALLALAARPRLGAIAEKTLTQPERKSLLPHAARPVEQERTGQGIAPDGGVEAGTECGMSVEWEQRHG